MTLGKALAILGAVVGVAWAAADPAAVAQWGAMLQHHPMLEGVGGGALLVALISCLPVKRPRTLDDWYDYLRDSLQTAVPAARRPVEMEAASGQRPAPGFERAGFERILAANEKPENPTPPARPAQP